MKVLVGTTITEPEHQPIKLADRTHKTSKSSHVSPLLYLKNVFLKQTDRRISVKNDSEDDSSNKKDLFIRNYYEVASIGWLISQIPESVFLMRAHETEFLAR